jgi:predicted naringenin-chalcone synthase
MIFHLVSSRILTYLEQDALCDVMLHQMEVWMVHPVGQQDWTRSLKISTQHKSTKQKREIYNIAQKIIYDVLENRLALAFFLVGTNDSTTYGCVNRDTIVNAVCVVMSY